VGGLLHLPLSFLNSDGIYYRHFDDLSIGEMKMFRRIVLVVFIVSAWISLLSAPITSAQAMQAARNWWAANNARNTSLVIKDVQSFTRDGQDLLWLITGRQGGFVLVSGDDAAQPVIGYDCESEFAYPVSCPAVSEWIDLCLDTLVDIRSRGLDNTDTRRAWEDLLAGRIPERDRDRDISPLLTMNWNQNYPYNALCPADANGPGGHVYAGCGAVAMAQIMRYWTCPVQGTGSHSYNCAGYGTLSANFGQTTYNWENMPNTCPGDNLDIPLLLYHCGIAVDMSYGSESSGTYASSVASALSQYFNYASCSYLNKSNYSSSSWSSMLRSSLNEGKPILYRGEGSSGGHLFNLDGFQGEDYFHFNWGWSGAYNGYFYLNNLNPGSYSFTNGQGGVIGVHPAQVLSPPQNVGLTQNGYQVTLSWNLPSATGCTGYKIYTDGLMTVTISGVDSTTFSCDLFELGDHLLQVSAVYPGGQSIQVVAGYAHISPPSYQAVWTDPLDQPLGWTVGPYWNNSNGVFSLYASPSPSNYYTSLDTPQIVLPANAHSFITTMYIRDVSANRSGPGN
jgi:hypothetical protein